jgi:phosphoglycerate dehydrogenase-like enzyme
MPELVGDGVSIANAAGVHDAGTAEMAVALALANLRALDTYARLQPTHTWTPGFGRSLADRHVLIYGYGRIGAAVERRVAGFEPTSVVRVARSARTDPEVHAAADLHALLPGADVVFITAPATPDTVGTFDATALALLPDGALVVNVGRGKIVDTDAIVAEAGRLRFALDVVDPEPLPAESPLWDAPGVTIAPHVGGANDSAPVRYDRLIGAQLAHLATGEPYENLVWGPLA